MTNAAPSYFFNKSVEPAVLGGHAPDHMRAPLGAPALHRRCCAQDTEVIDV